MAIQWYVSTSPLEMVCHFQKFDHQNCMHGYPLNVCGPVAAAFNSEDNFGPWVGPGIANPPPFIDCKLRTYYHYSFRNGTEMKKVVRSKGGSGFSFSDHKGPHSRGN